MRYRTIEIDIDVHKLIEAERRSFSERSNDALRRLLGLSEASQVAPPPANSKPWTSEGVTLPHGTLLRMSYNKRTYEGEVADGEWVIDGKPFTSPSGAASALGVTKKGDKTKLDGWIYWRCKRPGDDTWVLLDSLRPKRLNSDLTPEQLGL